MIDGRAAQLNFSKSKKNQSGGGSGNIPDWHCIEVSFI